MNPKAKFEYDCKIAEIERKIKLAEVKHDDDKARYNLEYQIELSSIVNNFHEKRIRSIELWAEEVYESYINIHESG